VGAPRSEWISASLRNPAEGLGRKVPRGPSIAEACAFPGQEHINRSRDRDRIRRTETAHVGRVFEPWRVSRISRSPGDSQEEGPPVGGSEREQ
jgi:hypothetical protein